MKCPALTLVAYPSLDAQACTKYLKCHIDLHNCFKVSCLLNSAMFIYSDVKHWKEILKVKSSGFFLPEDRGSPPNYPKIFSSPPSGKVLLSISPPLNYSIHVITPAGTSLLVYYNFTVFVNPSLANFDFNLMFNIYRMSLLPLKKLRRNSPIP